MCSTQIFAECITKIMRFHGKTIYDRAPYNEERQWKILRSNDDKRFPSPLQLHEPCLHKEKCQQRPMTLQISQGSPHLTQEDKRQHLRMLSEERKPCWKCEKPHATRVIFSTCGVMSVPRFAKKRGSRQSQTSGHFRHCVSDQPCVKKKPLVDDDMDNQIKSTSPSLLPMLFGGQREWVSPTRMTQQERGISSFSKHLGPRRFAETRVDGNRALKWDEIAREKGPGGFVRP